MELCQNLFRDLDSHELKESGGIVGQHIRLSGMDGVVFRNIVDPPVPHVLDAHEERNNLPHFVKIFLEKFFSEVVEDEGECAQIPKFWVVRSFLALHPLLNYLHKVLFRESFLQFMNLVRSEDFNEFIYESGHKQLYLLLKLLCARLTGSLPRIEISQHASIIRLIKL